MTQGPRAVAPRPLITLIVARAANGVIGLGNTLPWQLPEDLRHFKATTLGHVLVMGRKTFESIGRPLPGRRTIVLTRDPAWTSPGCECAGSIDEAIRLAGAVSHIFVAGGGEIYRAALDQADQAIITEIDLAPGGDAFFPPLDPATWLLQSRQMHNSASGVHYAIAHYRNLERAGETTGGSATIESTPP
jgi:dihydrofolate reductase